MTHVTCRLPAKNRDQLRNPTLGNRVRATFFNNARLKNRKLLKILFKLLYLRFPPLHIRTYVFRTYIFYPPVLSFSVLAFSVAPREGRERGGTAGLGYLSRGARPSGYIVRRVVRRTIGRRVRCTGRSSAWTARRRHACAAAC